MEPDNQQQYEQNNNNNNELFTELGPQAYHTFHQVKSHGSAVRPLDFPPPRVRTGVRVNALVVHPETGLRQVCSGVIHRQDLSGSGGSSKNDSSSILPQGATSSTTPSTTTATPTGMSPRRSAAALSTSSSSSRPTPEQVLAYWPQRRLQDAIYGSVWACLVLRRHYGVAADDAARAAGVEPGSSAAPIVWEITGQHVAIKMVEWARVHHMRGRLLEDPVKEVAAMQLLATPVAHPNVLGSTEVLQDGDFLYSVMPYCRDGDLFGIVVQYAEEAGGDAGMPEPVARHWFRQILRGLHHLQLQGVCHRDLSLENVLVHADVCMIIDFGMCLRVPYNDPRNTSAVTDVTRGTIHRRLMRPQGVCGKHNYMVRFACLFVFAVDSRFFAE
jgi:Protein kinase domain